MQPLTTANLVEIVGPWYFAYIAIPHDDLLQIILAANFMNIKPLLDLGCSYIASLIKDKPMETIKTTFNVTNDFTVEDEKALREDPRNKWAEEE